MAFQLRRVLLSYIAILPFQVLAQEVPPPAPPAPGAVRDLGLIAAGEERMFQVTNRLDLATATPDQVEALSDRSIFSIDENSGFCIAAMVPDKAAAAAVTFLGRTVQTGFLLFNTNSGAGGLTPELGRRSVVQTTRPIVETNFTLATLVGQTPMAQGDTVLVFVRAYPDTTPAEDLPALCGAF
jgi:hypothetical protein